MQATSSLYLPSTSNSASRSKNIPWAETTSEVRFVSGKSVQIRGIDIILCEIETFFRPSFSFCPFCYSFVALDYIATAQPRLSRLQDQDPGTESKTSGKEHSVFGFFGGVVTVT